MKKLTLSVLMTIASYTLFAQTLVAHWTFDNGNANDVSGNNLHGIVNNTTAVAGKAGIPNTALQFNGSSSTVDVPYDSKMNLNSLTIVAVVKPSGFNSGACQGSFILGRGNGWNPGTHPYNIHMTDNAWDAGCNVYTPTAQTFVTNFPGTTSNTSGSIWQYTPTINLNQWYCIVSTMDGSNVRVYIDGILKITIPYTPNTTLSSFPISIGYNSAELLAGYPYFFNGIIDDIELWDGVLSAQDITAKCAASEEKVCKIDDVDVSYSALNPKAFKFTPVTAATTGQIKWTFGDGNSQTTNVTQPVNYTYAGNGNYTICAQIWNGETACEEKVCFDICIGNPLKVKETGTKPAIADPYPNPAGSVLMVPVRSVTGKVSISVYSADGKMVMQQTETLPAGENKIQLPTQNMAPGIYLLDIREGDQRRTRTFSKQ